MSLELRILCCTDFSERSRAALDAALVLAEHTGSSVDVLHIWEPPAHLRAELTPWTPVRFARIDEWHAVRRRFHELVKEVDPSQERHVTPFLIEGEAIEEIVKKSSEYDLIVMGGSRRGGLQRVLSGSVTEEVLRRADCPVLTIRDPRRRFEIERVLVPVDLSEKSRDALELAGTIARVFGAKLDLYHAQRRSSGDAAEPSTRDWVPSPGVSSQLHDLRDWAQQEGLPIGTEIIDTGDAAEGICEQAALGGYGMVVMATRGRPTLMHLLAGGVTERVVRTSVIPVLTLRAHMASGEFPAYGHELDGRSQPGTPLH